MKKASQIAKAFLKLSQPEIGDTVSNLKLQKLLYYAQGFNLAINNKPLFEENLIAWEHGPVVKEVYDIYSKHSSNSIPVPEEEVKLSGPEIELIDNVWKVYGQFSAWRLRQMTHDEAPWKSTTRNQTISQEKLKTFFKTLVTNG
jgi:uncharacterized phage-associated protein